MHTTNKRKRIPLKWATGVMLLAASLPVQSAGPWAYNCTMNPGIARYDSPMYSIEASGDIEIWKQVPYVAETYMTATDNQGVSSALMSQNISTMENTHLSLLSKDVFFGSSFSATIYTKGGYIYGAGAPEPIDSGTAYLQAGCKTGSGNCAELLASQADSIQFTLQAKISFLGSSNFDAPVTNATLVLPVGPKNEYQQHVITFRHYYAQLFFDTYVYPGTSTIPAGPSQAYSVASSDTSITCTRDATPLVLTLGASSIDFGAVMVGSTPVTRSLTWTATGSGQAGSWTLTFQPSSADTSGKYIRLGGASISVLDSGNNLVALNTPVNISGTSGSYTLSLDPTKGTPGAETTILNVTLTAN